MTQNEQLQAAVTRVGNSVSAEIKAVSDKLASMGSDSPVIGDAIISLNKAADVLDAEAVSLAPAVATVEPEQTPSV